MAASNARSIRRFAASRTRQPHAISVSPIANNALSDEGSVAVSSCCGSASASWIGGVADGGRGDGRGGGGVGEGGGGGGGDGEGGGGEMRRGGGEGDGGGAAGGGGEGAGAPNTSNSRIMMARPVPGRRNVTYRPMPLHGDVNEGLSVVRCVRSTHAPPEL